MPKKKTPKNAFYFFMRDFREEQEQMGHVFRGGMKEVADLAGPAWKEISPEQRLYYENLAAQEKMKDKGNLANKFTTTGVSYAQLQREEDERRSTEMRMNMEIEGTVHGLSRASTLKTHVFYFIHFNYYCRLEDGSHLICEVALAQFNLKEGVRDVYHTIIRHDRIPTGYSFEAKQTSEETHQIPMPHDLTEGEPYRGKVFYYIKKSLEENKLQNGHLPPVYTIDNHVEIAQGALNSLAEFHYPQDPEIFRVYPLSKLFYQLRNAAASTGYDGFPSETLAERELDKDQYNFAPGIACSMHEKKDTCVYCSKSLVQRWAFLICDHCCKDLNITMLRGKHVPINAAIEVELPDQSSVGAVGGDDFVAVSRRNGRCGARDGGPRGGGRRGSSPHAPERVAEPPPIHVVDHSKIGSPEETATHVAPAAAAAAAPTPSTPSVSAPNGGVSGAKGAWASGGKSLVWGKAEVGPGRGAIPKSKAPGGGSGSGWRANGDTSAATTASPATERPAATLRHPTSLPPSIASALNFTEADFPDLGGGSSRGPAAVSGRGRGRARLLVDVGEAAPGGLNEFPPVGVVQSAVGRGQWDNKRGARLGANFQGLSLD